MQATPFAIVSITYDVITPESAEHGDFEESGFDTKDETMTLAELIQTIKQSGFYIPSEGGKAPRWISTDPDINYRSGDETIRSLHIGQVFGKQPTPKQLARIYRLAGLK